MEEEEFKTLADIEAARPIYLGPCDTFSIPVKRGVQALTVIEAEAIPETHPVKLVAMRRESGPPAGVRKLYKRHYAVWVN